MKLEQEVVIPALVTARLTLRAFQLHEVGRLHAMVSRRAVIRYLPRPEPWPAATVERWVQRHWEHWATYGFGWWAVEARPTGALMGWCGLNRLDTGEVEVLYLLDQPYWGQGYASEGARASVAYGLERAGVGEIIGLAHAENGASRRVLVKAGLAEIGPARYSGMELVKYATWVKSGPEAGVKDKGWGLSTSCGPT